MKEKNRMNKKQKRIRFHRANEVILWYDVRNGVCCKLTSVLSVFWDEFASIRLFFCAVMLSNEKELVAFAVCEVETILCDM